MNLEKVYQEPEHPGSFGGVEALFKATDGKFSRKDIKKWLSAKDSYTLHKPIKKKFKKNRVLISRMNQQYQADLVDMQSLSKFNGGFVTSDSSKHFFPGNKTSHFTTQLRTPITLNDEWEMGLVDFIYPHTWYNIREDNNLFGFDLGDEKSIARRIPQGFYESIPDILDGMYLEDFKNKIEFLSLITIL
ncbi:uncharacterized protein TNCV_2027131 [Trichonephila clavipes]|nr:uncharacterized protein TNCV_2027131 [Trichonephila clavipes]